MPKTYAYNGLAGCIVQCMSLPGVTVGLYHAGQAKFDASSGPWATVCEHHGTIANHKTMDQALGHLFLVDWCEACQRSFQPDADGQGGGRRLQATWSEDRKALLFRRARGRPPLRVEPANSHDPLILQKPTSFVSHYDYTLSDYEGCEYACTYCYTPLILHGLADKLGGWGSYCRPRFRCVEYLEKRAGELAGARIFFPATTDAYQRMEQTYRLTRSLLEKLLDIPFAFLLISTRSGLVVRDLDLFTDQRLRGRIEIGISISSDQRTVHDALEPDTPSYEGRFKVARTLREHGIATRIHAAPLGIHSQEFLEKVADAADWLWIDGTGHGARKEEPARSLLYDYAQSRAFADEAKAALGEERVAYGSAGFGHCWDATAQRIALVSPKEAMVQRRKLACSAR